MAKPKKNFTYLFKEGEVTIPSSYQAKCNVTGEIIPIYHKFLVKMIEGKYKNSFEFFVKTFKKRGADEQIREEQGLPDEPEETKLNEYSKYLAICWKTEKNRSRKDLTEQESSNIDFEIQRIEELYSRRFKRNVRDDIDAK